MLIYTHAITPRCRYAFELVFRTLLQLEFSVTDSLEQFNAYQREKVAYTSFQPSSGFFIESKPLLFEEELKEITIDPFPFAGTVAFFQTRSGHMPFDIFAACFFLVTRYEEYMLFEPDKYGRYQASNSVAFRHGFLHTPVVNCWVQELKKSLILLYPFLHVQDGVFQPVISFDIDMAYAYKGRSYAWNVLALLKDLALLKTSNFAARLKVTGGKAPDPFDTYADIKKMLAGSHAETIFFFLLKRVPTRYDKNLSSSSPELRQLIREISAFTETGIHPSYYTMDKPALIRLEKQRLETIVNRPVLKSRQHYLRFRLPETYVQLAEAGIAGDYSMGYAGTPGFRAGICTPFFFFNLKTNRATALKIHPVAYMDGQFIEDLHMQPRASMETISKLISAVKKVNGYFLCIWHNHTVSETGAYKGWRQVLQETLYLINE